ncbi:Thioredoxin [Sphingobacterium faecium PCAi_F2.5]|nr:Thioredoxin [Sphingobacterium faecium PCAi_F2.5]
MLSSSVEFHKTQDDMKYIFKFLVGVILFTNSANAQNYIRVGQKIQDSILNLNLKVANYDRKTTISLDDYQDKLVILDYWASWCSSCINTFPKIDSLQREFKDSLHVIFVDVEMRDDEDKISSVFKRVDKYEKSLLMGNIPSVYGNKFFAELFDVKSLPHYIWIRSGNVVASTGSEEVTRTNIENILKCKDTTIGLAENGISEELPAGRPNQDNLEDSTIRFRSTIKGYEKDSKQNRNNKHMTDGKIDMISKNNRSILELYSFAYGYKGKTNQVLLEVNNPRLLLLDNNSSDEKMKKLFSYELILPPTTQDSILEIMKTDLVRYFGYTAKLQNRRVKSLVISIGDLSKLPMTKGGKTSSSIDSQYALESNIINKPVSYIVEILNRLSEIPVVNETKFSGNVDLLDIGVDLIKKNPSSLNAFIDLLKKNGFKITETERELKMFVISQSKARTAP